MNTYICRYCRQPSDPGSPTCPMCGAPVDIRSVVSDSGWVEQPPIRDMARLQFGQSHCQIAGTTVPVAEFNLAPEDWVYFSHHVLLWTEPQTRLANMPMSGGWNRKMAGLPLIMVEGRGPGHIALSDNHAGEVVALPMQHGQQIWVREHRFLCRHRQHQVRLVPDGRLVRDRPGLRRPGDALPDGAVRRRVRRAGRPPACCCCTRRATTFIRDLRQGETLLIQPSSLLYRDVSVRVALHLEYPRNMGFVLLAQLVELPQHLGPAVGPGRVAVQSVYEPAEDTEAIRRHSYATTHRW